MLACILRLTMPDSDMDFFIQSRLPNLGKLLDSKKFPSHEMEIAAASDILKTFVYQALALNKEGFPHRYFPEAIRPLGVVGFPLKKTEKSLFEMVSEAALGQLKVKLDRSRHIIIGVPTGIIGSSTYVIFELPT